MNIEIDRRPVFTVGQVWIDFVKRLPEMSPRFKGEQPKFSFPFGIGLSSQPTFYSNLAQQAYNIQAYQPQNNPSGWTYGIRLW